MTRIEVQLRINWNRRFIAILQCTHYEGKNLKLVYAVFDGLGVEVKTYAGKKSESLEVADTE